MIKIKSTVIAAVAASIMASSAFAFTSIVKLQTEAATVQPNGGVNISLSRLHDDVVYNVTCTITSDGKSKQAHDYIKVDRRGYDSNGFFINDAGMPYGQGKIDANPNVANILKAIDVTNSDNNISVMNLDDTDTITVKNCYAEPIS